MDDPIPNSHSPFQLLVVGAEWKTKMGMPEAEEARHNKIMRNVIPHPYALSFVTNKMTSQFVDFCAENNKSFWHHK